MLIALNNQFSDDWQMTSIDDQLVCIRARLEALVQDVVNIYKRQTMTAN